MLQVMAVVSLPVFGFSAVVGYLLYYYFGKPKKRAVPIDVNNQSIILPGMLPV